MVEQDNSDQTLAEKLLSQTAKIEWEELIPYYARDVIWVVDYELDLIEVATTVIEDDAEKVKSLMKKNQLKKVDHEIATTWSNNDSEATIELWAVVVAPWVFVQDKSK